MTLEPFFTPKGIAVLGASADPGKLGYGVARNLIMGGYPGAVHLVNLRGGTLFDRPLYPSLEQVPDPVDLAVIIVPAPTAPQALRETAARGIRAAILVPGGFRETGPKGAALEAECLAIAREHGLRLIGPNCIGILDTHIPFDTTFLPTPPPSKGDIAFLSHSGAFCAAIIDWSRQQGLGFSRLISLGNQADVTETDLLPLVAADPHTRVIALYLESLSQGERFIQTTRQLTPHKPIVALKVGRTAAGQRAAASHTGALAGAEAAYDAAFRKAGVIRAETAEELFDWARVLAAAPLPQGRKIAILTDAGGPGVIAADALERHRLALAELSPATQAALRSLLPPAASLHNPVDMLASATPAHYAESLRLLLADSQVDGALVVLPPPPMYPAEDAADALIPLIQASAKPVTMALMGSDLVATAFQRFTAARVPVYPFPERAASALACLAERAEFIVQNETQEHEGAELLEPRANTQSEPQRHRDTKIFKLRDSVSSWSNFKDLGLSEPSLAEPDHPAIAAILNQIQPDSNDPEPVSHLMQALSIQTAPVKLARSESEARELAATLGFPLVLKIASPDILHKSDIGGVLLDINSIPDLITGYTTVMARARATRPDARIEGVTIQRQVPAGQDVIIGAVRDPQFGALIMFGSGGVEVEGLKDIAFGLAPLTQAEAEKMLRATWAGRKLAGFRNIPPVDQGAAISALIRLGQLAAAHPEIAEIEINPLRVLAQGAVALDVRIKL